MIYLLIGGFGLFLIGYNILDRKNCNYGQGFVIGGTLLLIALVVWAVNHLTVVVTVN